MGLGAERAFYNLAGINLLIAKTAYSLNSQDEEVDRAFAECVRVYEAVRTLRQVRYQGRSHAHLAACIHGLALVTYYRALFGRPDADLVSAVQLAGDGLVQRSAVAVGLTGDPASALTDGDVGKSMRFLIKASVAAYRTYEDLSGRDGLDYATAAFAEANREYEGQ